VSACECGCGQEVARRFARGHSRRKARVITTENGVMKTCTKCEALKALDQFGTNKKARDGRSSWCMECSSAYLRENPTHHDPASTRTRKLRVKYGITDEGYDRMLAEQDGKCAICGRTGDEVGGRWARLAVDHDHQTDEVRGLLCSPCNSAIGLLQVQDSPEIVMSAAAYLLAHQAATEGAGK
jgi:hypothetical protein